jgi:hypothetical protein
MRKTLITTLLLLILSLLFISCSTYKQVDDTEHLWIGNNKETFYE